MSMVSQHVEANTTHVKINKFINKLINKFYSVFIENIVK